MLNRLIIYIIVFCQIANLEVAITNNISTIKV